MGDARIRSLTMDASWPTLLSSLQMTMRVGVAAVVGADLYTACPVC